MMCMYVVGYNYCSRMKIMGNFGSIIFSLIDQIIIKITSLNSHYSSVFQVLLCSSDRNNRLDMIDQLLPSVEANHL